MDWTLLPLSKWVWFPLFALIGAVILSVRFEMYTTRSAWFCGLFVSVIFAGTYLASLLENGRVNIFVMISAVISPFIGSWLALALKRLR